MTRRPVFAGGWSGAQVSPGDRASLFEMRDARGLPFALVDPLGRVLAEGIVGEWTQAKRSGLGVTACVDLPDGDLLLVSMGARQ